MATARMELWRCKSCFESFQDEIDIYHHTKNNDCPKSKGVFKCHVPNCDRHYGSSNSYGKHLSRCHKNSKVFSERVPNKARIEVNFREIEPKKPRIDIAADDVHQPRLQGIVNNLDQGCCLENEYDCESDESDSNDDFDEEDSDYFSSDDFGDGSFFERKSDECAGDFVAKLYMYSSIPRKIVMNVIKDSSDLCDESLDNISDEIVQTSKTRDLDPNTVSVVLDILKNHKDRFKKLKTEKKCFKYFKNCDTFIYPESYAIGERQDYREKYGEMLLVHIPVCVQYILLSKVLKIFLELPGMFERTVEYLKELMNDELSISNNVQGSYLKFWRLFSEGLIILPLFIYFDDYENNNPIGSYRGVNKCGAVYVSIPCLPPEYQSKIENIFLFLLFNTLDRAVFSNKMTFAKAIEELNLLQTEGITLDLPTGPMKVIFKVRNLIGDNLGIHAICNFVQYFRTKFFCHLCLTEYSDISTKLTEDDCILRNPENYSEMLAKNNPQESGMDGECVWNNLDNFHATVNITEDVMHDWYEGICRYDVAIALHDLIYVQKSFELKDLNSRIRSFYYGPKESTNKPPEILEHQLKNKCLIMTSAEMHSLVTRLPMIIGFLLPEEDEILRILIQMKRIIDIVSSKTVQPDTHKQLKVLISEYLESKRELFENEKDKPKHHLGLHGPSSMEKFGPLTKIFALRFEAKNQEGKTISRTAKARLNVCRTIAMRHQLMFNYRLRMKKPPSRFETAEEKCNLKDTVTTVEWVKICDNRIDRNCILVLFDDKGPAFYVVHYLIVIDDDIRLITKKLRDCFPVQRVHAYEVHDKDAFSWSSLTLNGVRRAFVTYSTTLSDGGTYIFQNWIE
ncbi:hypothetical protein QAD02_013202 [Eretmocerus hayati]|uniref:Uncharacterized protein n=1 Tax=Eretmocerus hayati TaxID=131215 RepID=A0ACC2P6K0_9HYME|nr:hypothetical protein QAD02_013202 [Eretmocerus hayati]